MFDIQLPVIIPHAALLTVAFFTGTLVYLHNKKSATNQVFAALVLIITIWSVGNFLSFTFTDPYLGLLGVKTVMVSASMLTICILIFAYIFPRETAILSSRVKWVMVLGSMCYMAIGHFVWTGVDERQSQQFGSVIPTKGDIIATSDVVIPIIAIWGSILFVLTIWSAWILIAKYRTTDQENKRRYLSVIIGFILTTVLLPALLVVPVALTGDPTLNYYSPLAYIPLFFGAGYGILRHHIFNVKLLLIEILVLTGVLILFVNLFI